MKRQNQKSKTGISLIVLVITIIVIIILAVAVILSISNNNPIENARKARFLNDLKTIQEEVALHIGKQYVEKNGNYNPSTDTEINKILENYPEYDGKIIIEAGNVVVDGSKVSDNESDWAKENGIKIITLPTIPVGFKYLEGEVDTGYVIQNETDGNEFVWVPVEEFSTFERESFTATQLDKTKYTEPYKGTGADPSEKAEYDAMYKSVQKYGGFYIARYEASDNGSGVAQSKANIIPWTLKWGESMTDLSGGAVEKARAVYPNSDKADGSKYAVSTLCYGVQWDVTVRWLKKNYPTITEDSRGLGNYKVSSSIPTGSNENYKTNNIYDMCGNVSEWTMEVCNGNGRINRGGAYTDSTINSPVYVRNPYASLNNSYTNLGFRLLLYIK